jgi:DUF4097 and DUF4098 domain-containing protein YvlB
MTMRFLDPSRTSRASYASARRDTLNFENGGGEPHVAETAAVSHAAEQPAPVLNFPSATNSWITVNIHRKDITMTEADQAEGFSERRGNERRAQYSPTGPVHVLVDTQSGDVTVRATDTSDILVTLRATSPNHASALDAVEMEFDAEHNTLSIRTQPHGSSPSSRKSSRAWLDFGSSDVDVTVDVPRGSALRISTVSGDTSLSGSLGTVAVSSVSGDVVARDSSDALEVATASGDIRSGHVLTTLSCKSASGDVTCQGVAAHTEIHSASGDILLSADQPGNIVVRNVSGDVVVRVARGLVVDIMGDTLSGTMGTNIDLDGGDDASNDEDLLVIKVSTVSGDIRIDKAS